MRGSASGLSGANEPCGKPPPASKTVAPQLAGKITRAQQIISALTSPGFLNTPDVAVDLRLHTASGFCA